MTSPIDISARQQPIAVKNRNGFSERYSFRMVPRIRNPSRQVLSLLNEPSGRAKYGVSSSATGSASSSACTLSSVSISKPSDSTGKDLTKRRENTRYPDRISLNDLPNTDD